MSGVEELVVNRLLATPAVTAIVGTRIHPGSAPQAGQLPVIVYNRIGGGPLYDDQGEAGLDQVRLQIDCWDVTYTGAKTLSRAVRTALSAFFDTTSLYLEIENERDLREGGSDAAEYLFRTSMDFIILARS